MDLKKTLTSHILDMQFDALPNEPIVAAQKSLLDILGTWLAAAAFKNI